MNAFSLVMPYHSAAAMLQVHAATLNGLPYFLRGDIDIRICDDASPSPIEHASFRKTFAGLGFYRIAPPHIRWSHRCATNIAAHHATGEWLLITDMDHVAEVGAWRKIGEYWLHDELDAGTVYTFERKEVDDKPYKPHPDSWLIHRTMWARIGGYDTRYRGHYGQNMPFKMRVDFHARKQERLPVALTRFSRDVVADASMPDAFGRKSDIDRRAIADLSSRFMREGSFYKPGEVIPHSVVFEC